MSIRLHYCAALFVASTTLASASSTTFINPVGPATTSSADPFVMHHTDGNYYFVHTSAGWDRLEVTRAATLSGIGAGKTVTVFHKTTGPCNGPDCLSKDIWAPEIDFIDGAWYLYFSASGDDEMHRIWVMRNTAADPTTGTWSTPVRVHDSADQWAIDQTVQQINGHWYMAWSEISAGNPQRIMLAKMSSPTTLVGRASLISTPTLDWEKVGGTVNEGPQFLVHGNQVHLSYSASACWTDDYKLGWLSAPLGSDLTVASNWTKSAVPILQKSPGAYGPGHNGFVKSPDGTEDWIIYHANPASGQGCGDSRTARIQKITWNGDWPVIGAPTAPGLPAARPSGEGNATIWYRLRNQASGKVMSIDRSMGNGAQIWQFTNFDNPDQWWALDPVGGGQVQLTSRYNGNVADVYNFSKAPGAYVKSYPAIGTSNQHWQLVPSSTQYFGVRNANSGLMLDLQNGSQNDRAIIQQWTDNGQAPQRWLLERVN